jgi:4-oxalocrotonate tautomerase
MAPIEERVMHSSNALPALLVMIRAHMSACRGYQLEEIVMPFVNVKLVDGVFSPEEKHAMAAALTDVMVKFEGSEAFREVVWVLIEELHTDGWHIGGRPFEGPKSLLGTLSRSKDVFMSIDGRPTTRAEWAKLAPVKAE